MLAVLMMGLILGEILYFYRLFTLILSLLDYPFLSIFLIITFKCSLNIWSLFTLLPSGTKTHTNPLFL